MDEIVRPALTQAMLRAPVPDMIWRTATQATTLGGQAVPAGAQVVLGIGSVTNEQLLAGKFDATPIFGGRRYGDESAPPDPHTHACPGFGAAMGVVEGGLGAALLARTVRVTGNPLALEIIAPAPTA